MVDIAPPSGNPADIGSTVGLFRQVLSKFLQGVDDMLPARVIAFDRDKNLVQVQPLIMVLTTDDRVVSRAQVASIPVFQIGAGGYVLNFPIQAGDIGWIKANDRDISLFMQSFSEQGPNTLRKHSFEDAVFFPNVLTGYTINGEDDGNVVLQTLDGSQRVSIWPDKVKITSDTRVVIDAPITEFTGEIIAGTNPSYGDTATFNGNIRTLLDVVAGFGGDDISLLTHTHSGITPGGGNTGQPVPV